MMSPFISSHFRRRKLVLFVPSRMKIREDGGNFKVFLLREANIVEAV